MTARQHIQKVASRAAELADWTPAHLRLFLTGFSSEQPSQAEADREHKGRSRGWLVEAVLLEEFDLADDLSLDTDPAEIE